MGLDVLIDTPKRLSGRPFVFENRPFILLAIIVLVGDALAGKAAAENAAPGELERFARDQIGHQICTAALEIVEDFAIFQQTLGVCKLLHDELASLLVVVTGEEAVHTWRLDSKLGVADLKQ